MHVLLPVHGRREVTRRFVECLKRQTYPAVRLLVVDDGSTDGTTEAVVEVYPSVDVIRGDGSLWWAGSVQAAINKLHGEVIPENDIVLLANDDTTFERDFLERAVRYLGGRHGVMLLSRIRNPVSGDIEESGMHADLRALRFQIATDPSAMNCLSTRGLFMRWGDMKKVGGFFPRALPHYLSDYEFTIRAHRRGLRCVTTESVWLHADLHLTGTRNVDTLVGWRLVRTLFSVKCAINPVYMTCFVVLAVPLRWIVPNLLRVWWPALKLILRQGLLRLPRPDQ